MLPAIQVILFCAVGLATTFIDFTLFNLLTRPTPRGRRLPIIPANTISVAVAMAWSFLANWFIVFQPAGQDWLGRAGRFLMTTAFSAFVLQNLVLYFTTKIWKGPARASLLVAQRLRLKVTGDAISRNTCKLLAVSVGLIWNFCWYKFFVYL